MAFGWLTGPLTGWEKSTEAKYKVFNPRHHPPNFCRFQVDSYGKSPSTWMDFSDIISPQFCWPGSTANGGRPLGDVESTKYLENRHATLFIKLNSQFILVNDCLHPRILQAGLARLVSRVLFKPVQLRNVSASKDSMRRNDRRVNYM